MQVVLFLCSGNYYRSRYAEILFNWQAQQQGLAWQADSRGLELDPRNPGPMSRDAMAALRHLEIPYDKYLRMPIPATEKDLRAAHHIVAVKAAEHRPLIARDFPTYLDRVEFWHVHDLDFWRPEEAIPQLDREVAGLVERMQQTQV